MKGIERITARIEADAQAEIDRILADAKAEAEKIAAQYQAQADAEAVGSVGGEGENIGRMLRREEIGLRSTMRGDKRYDKR